MACSLQGERPRGARVARREAARRVPFRPTSDPNQTRAGVTVENRMRILRLIENMTLGRNAVGYLTESLHGAGSPQAQRIQIQRQMNITAKKAMAARRA